MAFVFIRVVSPNKNGEFEVRWEQTLTRAQIESMILKAKRAGQHETVKQLLKVVADTDQMNLPL